MVEYYDREEWQTVPTNKKRARESLAKKLEIVVEEEGVTTLLGLVQRQNGRFPREGDQAELGAYQLVVKNETEDGWLIEIHHTLDGQGDL